MEITNWTALEWLILALPLAIGIFAVRIGSRQVREFHRHTGDTGVIMSITGLSRFPHEDESTEKPAHVAEAGKTPQEAEAA